MNVHDAGHGLLLSNVCCLLFATGSAELDELPTDSLKRIRETYKAFKAVSSSWAEAAAQGDPARVSNHSAAGMVSLLCHECCQLRIADPVSRSAGADAQQ